MSSGDRGAPAAGKSTAARVSRGAEYDASWPGLVNKAPKRDTTQHVTVTVTTYNCVEGGVPSADDVKAAIADLFALYAACKTDRRLQDVAQEQVVAKQSEGVVHVPSAVFAPAPTPAPTFGAGVSGAFAFPRDDAVDMSG